MHAGLGTRLDYAVFQRKKNKKEIDCLHLDYTVLVSNDVIITFTVPGYSGTFALRSRPTFMHDATKFTSVVAYQTVQIAQIIERRVGNILLVQTAECLVFYLHSEQTTEVVNFFMHASFTHRSE